MGCRAEATAVTEVTTGDPRGRVKSGHTVAQVARPAQLQRQHRDVLPGLRSVWQGGERRTAAQRVVWLGKDGKTQFNRDITKPQIFERFEWQEAMECFEWYLGMCRDAREGFGQFRENLSEMFTLKAGSRAASGHHLSGQVAGVSTMPEALLSRTAPPNPGSF